MPIFEQAVLYIALGLFSLGIFLMHLRLRNKASLAVIISFSSIIAWITFSKRIYDKYLELTAVPSPPATSTAEAFAKMSFDGYDQAFETASSIFILSMLLVFCIAFLFSAKSIPCLTTQSSGTSV